LGTEKLGVINTGLGLEQNLIINVIELLIKEYENLHFKIDTTLYDLTLSPIRNTNRFLV
jgi:hypothetical protein